MLLAASWIRMDSLRSRAPTPGGSKAWMTASISSASYSS